MDTNNKQIFRILCFGDSNTWGFDTNKYRETGSVEHFAEPWPALLQNALGENFEITIDGLNGRLTNIDDPTWENRNSSKQIEKALTTASFDLVILMLGTNDLKYTLSRTPEEIAEGIRELIHLAHNKLPSTSKILIIAPPIIRSETAFDCEFRDAIEKSKHLPALLKQLAINENTLYLDTNALCLELAWDGIHLTAEDHVILANTLYKILSENLI